MAYMVCTAMNPLVQHLHGLYRAGPFAGLIAALALAVATPGLAGAALPTPVAASEPGLRQVGRGELSWLGFDIYEASLWSADGRFAGFEPGRPVALSLWYQRKFTREELLEITTGEWRRLDLGPAASRERWAARLREIWRNVDRGDNMTTVVVPGGETRFYDASGLVGRIEDPEFGPAFLSIWLDPRSAVRGLRGQLLGATR